MPIDDALEKIQITETANVNEKEIKKVEDITEKDALRDYLKAYNNKSVQNRIRNNHPFSEKSLIQFTEWIRFNTNCCGFIGGVPQNRLLEIIGSENSELRELISETDLKEDIPDPFFPSKEDFYKGLPKFLNLKKELNYDELIKFENATKECIIIPNLTVLSLFIGEGKLLREYAKIVGDKFHWLCIIDSYNQYCSCNEVQIFSVESVKKFYDQTKTKNLKKMIKEVEGFMDEFTGYKNNNNRGNFGAILYRKLKQYNPHLTV